MSRTRVHKPLQFCVPSKDVVQTGYKNHFYIKNWRTGYDQHYSRIPAEKVLRKILNKRELTIIRDELYAMRYDPELFEDFTEPTRIQTLYYLN